MQVSPSLTSVLWHVGGLFCHQLPDRSPQFDGAVFPLCFRCTGLYLSLLTAFAFLAANGGYRRQIPELRCGVWIALLTVPFLVDGWANVLGIWTSDGWVRALTGVGTGLVLPLFLVPLAQRPGLSTGLVMKPTLSQPFALLPSIAVSIVLIWLVAHPIRVWIFQALAVIASLAPLLFLSTFLLAGWRNRAVFSRVAGVAVP